jgi:hypothetical protein
MKDNALVLHSFMAFVVLLMLLLTIANALVGWLQNKAYYTLEKDLRLGRLTLIMLYLQLAVGLYLFYLYPNGMKAIEEHGMEGLNPSIRLLAVEHPLINVVALGVLTLGWFIHSRFMDAKRKFKTIAIFYSLGLLLILSKIPWDRWLSMAKFD